MPESLAYFSRFQRDLLPPPPEIESWDFGVALSGAHDDLTGDYYAFILDKRPRGYTDTQLGIMMGDIVGSGYQAIPAWLMLHTLTQTESFKHSSPLEDLMMINFYLHQVHSHADTIVPALLGYLNPESGEFVYARAGLPSPIVVDARGQATVIPHQTGQPLLTSLAPAFDYHQIIVPKGGGLFLYSDGLMEMTDSSDVPFGVAGIIDTIRTHWMLPISDLCQCLLKTVHNYGEPNQDDCLVVGIKRV